MKVPRHIALMVPWLAEVDPPVEKEKYLTIQELVDLSEAMLMLHSCILYGLVEGELPNVERSEHYLKLGERHKVFPNKEKAKIILQSFFTNEQST